jgi:DeoR/GlpR family transcriptional regulator of sugar metabolism
VTVLGQPRRDEILRRIQRHGYVSASQLSEDFAVDPSTIRRDLDTLGRQGLVVRSHGGASMSTEAAEVPYAVKVELNVLKKRGIALAAAEQIAEGSSALIDSGSTTLEVARALRAHRGLTVITDDLRVGAELADHGGIRLLVTGGEVMPPVYTMIDERAVETIRRYHVNVAVLGTDAIDATGLTNSNSFEAPLKRAMIESAERVIVVADSSKFGRRALVRIADLDQIDLVITDDAFDQERADQYDVEILRVPPAASLVKIA